MMKLSIITVNLNNAEGLRKTIESVVTQTFTDFEYIIIDGGSTDGSVDIIKQYADKITYWVSEPDKGIYNAMNKGILQAKSEYVQFLNSGDSLVNENVLDVIFKREHQSDVINGDHIRKYPDEEVLIKSFAIENGGKFTLFALLDGYINHQSTFIKRKLFDTFGLYDENYKIMSDWIFFLKTIGMNDCSFEYINVPVCYFDMSGICITQADLREQERKKGFSALPANVRTDYEKYREVCIKFRELNAKYNRINARYDYLFKYKITYLVARVMNRLLRIFVK